MTTKTAYQTRVEIDGELHNAQSIIEEILRGNEGWNGKLPVREVAKLKKIIKEIEQARTTNANAQSKVRPNW